MRSFPRLFAVCWLVLHAVTAIDVDFGDSASVKSAAAIVAKKLMSYYSATPGVIVSNIPGLLPGPYYWWEAGGMFGVMIDYWKFTGDTTYNDMTTDALLHQAGPHDDYMPLNQTLSLGNDDQAFWALAALSAAETNFPNPTGKGAPSWLGLAQAVFNEQIARWNTEWCNGGLQWQIFEANNGYALKNSISNGCLFTIAARLARYTGDPDNIYSIWPDKIWVWMERIGLIDQNHNVYDNSEARVHNCSELDRNQWAYNAAILMVGAANMWNITEDELWRNRTQGLVNTFAFGFFPGGVLKDICEQHDACNNDQKSFKAYVSRWLATTTQLAPYTYDKLYPLLLSSATAAAKQCSGGTDGTTCGLKWYQNETWDGTDGPGQQMGALEIILTTLVKDQPAPLTNVTGGTSAGNPTAGFNATDTTGQRIITPASKADRIGAWILTAFLIASSVFGCYFLSTSSFESGGAGPKVRDRRRTKRLSRMRGAPAEGEVLHLGRGSVGVLPSIEEKAVPIHMGGTVPT